MTMDEGIARFLDLEERANHLATELEKLRDETVYYTEAANGLDVAITKLEPILATLTELVDKSQNVIETLDKINTSELLANAKDIATQLEQIKRQQKGGLITRLFGGRHG